MYRVNSKCQNALEKRHSLSIHVCKFVVLDLGLEWKDFEDTERQAQGLAPFAGKAE